MAKMAKGSEEGRRRALLDAALKLFAEYGYEGTTEESVARAAGLPLAAFLLLFPSKIELYRALLAEAVELLGDYFRQAADEMLRRTDTGAERLEIGTRLTALAGAYLRFFDEHRELYFVSEVLYLKEAPSLGVQGTAPLLEAGAAAILGIVAEVDVEGDPWETAVSLWAMLDGALISALKKRVDLVGLEHAREAGRALAVMLEAMA